MTRELTEFEKHVYLVSYAPQEMPPEEARERVIEQAAKLLELAKNELMKDNVIIRYKWFQHLKKEWYRRGYIEGKYSPETDKAK